MGNLNEKNSGDALPYTMRCWAYIVKNKRVISISVGLILVLCIYLHYIYCNYNSFIGYYDYLAINFTKGNPNGEFFKVLLSIAGGVGIYYGLWINQKRIGEQNRQNNIVQNSNFDKRFSDAVGYLGRNNTTTILGGIHTLHQLAKEDIRYRSIVANLLCSYLRGNCEKLYEKDEEEKKKERDKIREEDGDAHIRMATPPIIIQTIIDVLFNNEDSTFKNENLNLSGTHLKVINFNGDVKNCDFTHSVLKRCMFRDIDNSDFYSAKLLYCHFSSSIYSSKFSFSSISECSFGRIGETLDFIDDCFFYSININKSRFYVAKMTDCYFYFSDYDDICFNSTTFKNTTIEDNLDKINYNNCPNKPKKHIYTNP